MTERLKITTERLKITAGGLAPDENFTVEEASRWLTCTQPVPLALLQKLGKDCSMYCRVKQIPWTDRPTPHQRWKSERAYPADAIREVFLLNPDSAPFVPKVPA